MNVLHLDGVAEILTLLEENGKMRFSEIMDKLGKGKDPPLNNAAALSYRLRSLENIGLIANNSEKEKGKQFRIYYEITERGLDAVVHLKALKEIMKK